MGGVGNFQLARIFFFFAHCLCRSFFFRKCTHSERGGSHLEWTASLCIFSVPALWNSSPIIMMPYSIHKNSSSVVPSPPKCQSKKKYMYTVYVKKTVLKWRDTRIAPACTETFGIYVYYVYDLSFVEVYRQSFGQLCL